MGVDVKCVAGIGIKVSGSEVWKVIRHFGLCDPDDFMDLLGDVPVRAEEYGSCYCSDTLGVALYLDSKEEFIPLIPLINEALAAKESLGLEFAVEDVRFIREILWH